MMPSLADRPAPPRTWSRRMQRSIGPLHVPERGAQNRPKGHDRHAGAPSHRSVRPRGGRHGGRCWSGDDAGLRRPAQRGLAEREPFPVHSPAHASPCISRRFARGSVADGRISARGASSLASKKAGPPRAFRARFRANAFGWKSQPAITRVREAVAEIKKVAQCRRSSQRRCPRPRARAPGARGASVRTSKGHAQRRGNGRTWQTSVRCTRPGRDARALATLAVNLVAPAEEGRRVSTHERALAGSRTLPRSAATARELLSSRMAAVSGANSGYAADSAVTPYLAAASRR